MIHKYDIYLHTYIIHIYIYIYIIQKSCFETTNAVQLITNLLSQ